MHPAPLTPLSLLLSAKCLLEGLRWEPKLNIEALVAGILTLARPLASFVSGLCTVAMLRQAPFVPVVTVLLATSLNTLALLSRWCSLRRVVGILSKLDRNVSMTSLVPTPVTLVALPVAGAYSGGKSRLVLLSRTFVEWVRIGSSPLRIGCSSSLCRALIQLQQPPKLSLLAVPTLVGECLNSPATGQRDVLYRPRYTSLHILRRLAKAHRAPPTPPFRLISRILKPECSISRVRTAP